MKKYLVISTVAVIIIALVSGWYFFFRGAVPTDTSVNEANKVTYRCDNGGQIDAVFSDADVTFSLSDGRTFTLLKASADSDIKFSNRDGSVVLWTKDYSAFLEENDESVYTGCVVSPLSLP